jgi:hypothetical protein
MRIDMKMAELKKELEAAKKLPAVTGYDEEQKNYYSFLTSVESFMKDMQKARDKGSYSDEDYNAMSEPTNTDFPLSKESSLFECELQSCSFNRDVFLLRKFAVFSIVPYSK